MSCETRLHCAGMPLVCGLVQIWRVWLTTVHKPQLHLSCWSVTDTGLTGSHRCWDTRKSPRAKDIWFKYLLSPRIISTGLRYDLTIPWQSLRSFSIAIEKSDVMRLMILEYFGGFYMDLDMECFRPLSDYFPNIKTSFVIDQERPMQTQILYGKPFSPMNSAMISRSGHPFLKLLIQQLPPRSTLSEYPLSLTHLIIVMCPFEQWDYFITM